MNIFMRKFYRFQLHNCKLLQLPAFLLAVVLVCSISVTSVFAASATDTRITADNHIQQTIDALISWCDKEQLANPSNAGVFSYSDWYAFSLGRLNTLSGKESTSSDVTTLHNTTSDYTDVLLQYIDDCYLTSDRLDTSKATEWHRICLTLAANGITPSLPLLADGTYYRGYTKSLQTQGVNGPIWALITLDSLDCDLPADACDTREQIASEILDSHIDGSGFAFTGTDVNIDITANALTALAPYYNGTSSRMNELSNATLELLKAAVEESLLFLSSNQMPDGGFCSDMTPSSESCSQVLIALTALSIDPLNDSRFANHDSNIVNALLAYQNTDGGFAHIAGDSSDRLASAQALQALTAYALYCENGTSLYDLTDSCAPLILPADTTYDNYNNQQTTASLHPLVILIPVILISLILLIFILHRRKH